MNNNYINNDADFEQFVNSTLTEQINYQNNNKSQCRYERQIISILESHKYQLAFTSLFTRYFINRAMVNDYCYSSTCCICMDTNNYCIKICDCAEVKYCFKCFKDYVKTSILSDPIKINNVINDWNSGEQKLNLTSLISCSVCHRVNMLELIYSTSESENTPQHFISFQNLELEKYLYSLDFFNGTVPASGELKWYLLFNRDGRIRYNLVPLELLSTLSDSQNNKNQNNILHTEIEINNEVKLRQAGLLYIFEIHTPTSTEHQQIKTILNSHANEPTETIKRALLKYNPARLKLI